ncbi:hypothetical protein AB0D99_10710 [Streptomyces sp. NPDC047971]|uniref:hypothetical protein n=1 Tax=Streptomyces sp. NPDC047971 TaxID=3154499 RepID=UPI0033F1BFC9
MDAATLAAVGTIVAGLAVAGASLVGHRSQSRTAQGGQVLDGYSRFVDDLQEERVQLRDQLAEKTTELAAAYAELASERASTVDLHRQIAELTAERDTLLARLVELEGRPA